MADILSALPITNGDSGLGEDELQIKTKGGTSLVVDGSAVTQPISAAALPLPAGASTEATLASLDGKVVACDTSALALEAGNLATIAGDTTSIDSKTPSLGQSNKAGSVPVTLASDQGALEVNVTSELTTFDDVDTAVAVAKNATSTHQYQNISGNTVYLKDILVSSSAAFRTLIYVGPLGTNADPLRYAAFTSAAELNLIVSLGVEIPIVDNDYITIDRKNVGSAAADVYSRIAGV